MPSLVTVAVSKIMSLWIKYYSANYLLISGNNKRLWNDLGVQHTQATVLKNGPIKHPACSQRKFEVIPDPVHVCKSMVQGWISNETIELPNWAVEAQELVTPTADIKHLRDLVLYEQGCDLKMASGLKLEDVNFTKRASSFDKMKVLNSTKYVNHTVAAALKAYSVQSGRKDILTTAYLIETASTWFTYMTSRNVITALNLGNVEAYNRAINSLHTFKTLIYDCKVGVKRLWKPWKSAVVLATDTILRLQDFVLREVGFDYFLPGRLTQDCLENIFSQLRRRQLRPTALQIKDNLKLLTVSQYMTNVKNSSYDWDSCEWLTRFPERLEDLAKKRKLESEVEPLLQNVKLDSVTKDQQPESIYDVDGLIDECENLVTRVSEENVVYYLAGMVMRQLSERASVCSACIESCMNKNTVSDQFAVFTQFKDYTGNALNYVNVETYNLFLELEDIFKRNISVFRLLNENLELKYYNLMMKVVSAPHLPECHKMKEKIIRRYIQFRLRVSRQIFPRDKRHDSKSMAI